MAGRAKEFRHTIAYLLVKLFVIGSVLTPRFLGLLLFSLYGWIAGFILVPYRKEIVKNLNFVYGESLSTKEKRRIVNGIFVNLGKTAFDAIKLPSYSKQKFNNIVKADTSTVKAALAEHQKGVITLGGHLSCFELQSQIYAMHDLPIIVIGAKLFDKRIDTIVENLRKRNGATYMHRDGVGRKLLKELKSNKIFGALLDQDATNDGAFADFLGKLAYTPTGPIRLALKFKIPLFFIRLERQADNSYEFISEGPIALPETGDSTEDLLILAQQYNSFISKQIRKCPEQWVWMHRRWKRKREDYANTPSITDYRRDA